VASIEQIEPAGFARRSACENPPMLTLTLVFVSVGLVLIAVSVPLIRRRVKPNWWYGVRLPATFADEWVWYEANAASGRDILVVGVLLVVLSIVLPWTGVSEKAYALTISAVATVGMLGAAAVGIVRANRLLARRRASNTPG
jgi:hypothetical protein